MSPCIVDCCVEARGASHKTALANCPDRIGGARREPCVGRLVLSNLAASSSLLVVDVRVRCKLSPGNVFLSLAVVVVKPPPPPHPPPDPPTTAHKPPQTSTNPQIPSHNSQQLNYTGAGQPKEAKPQRTAATTSSYSPAKTTTSSYSPAAKTSYSARLTHSSLAS